MFLINKIEKYPRRTLENSLSEVMKSKNRIIGGKYSPAVFNMEYVEEEYMSGDIRLYGWYIPSLNKGTKKTIIMAHGRFNNRIFCVRFLQMLKDIGADKEYNIFLPDLRNSGKSDETRTAFGYLFAEDIFNSMKMLKDRYMQDEFILYGFSQGGMGAAATPYLYEKEIKEYGMKVDKLILDSPVSNIRRLLFEEARSMKIPKFIINFVLNIFNKRIDNRLDELRLSILLGKVPTLLLQSEKDHLTKYKNMLDEYNLFSERTDDKEKLYFKVFRRGQHVRIYLEYVFEYTLEINNFINNKEI